MFPHQNILAKSVGHGVAAITLQSFGQKLNRIAGFGMGGHVSSYDLANAEELYSKNGTATEVDLYPYANATALQNLVLGRYTVKDLINNYVCILTDEDIQETGVSEINISIITTSERYEKLPMISAAGFKDNGRPEILLKTLGLIEIKRADTNLYIATINGKIAGSARLAQIVTLKGLVAHLYMDSTLPDYRAQGIQAALLRARLSEARRAGFIFASVGTRPGSISSRNVERAGFSLASTKVTLLREANDSS